MQDNRFSGIKLSINDCRCGLPPKNWTDSLFMRTYITHSYSLLSRWPTAPSVATAAQTQQQPPAFQLWSVAQLASWLTHQLNVEQENDRPPLSGEPFIVGVHRCSISKGDGLAMDNMCSRIGRQQRTTCKLHGKSKCGPFHHSSTTAERGPTIIQSGV